MNLKIWYALFFLAFSFSSFGRWEDLSFQGSKVFLYIPQNSGQAPLSLMVNLHGCAQKAQILKDFGNWEDAADKFNTIVAIPEVPNGGVIAGCWDYYGLNHSVNNRHNKFVIELTLKLIGDYNIVKDNVYVSGLSSGGGLSLVLGCMAPDIFKGIGLNAGPSVGTSSGEISRARISIENIVSNCKSLAGTNLSQLENQRASIIYGNNDFLVDPEYNKRNAKALAKIYGGDKTKSFDPSVFPGTSPNGIGTLYVDSRTEREVVSLIENTGLGHNWPAGKGGSSRSFVSQKSLNYPYYILRFFTGLDL